MSYASSFMYHFLPLEILLLGIILILCFGIFSSNIVKRVPKLLTRMRIVYGYIALVSSTISIIMYSYIYTPLNEEFLIEFNFKISAFSTGLFYTVSFATIIGVFLSIVETSLKYRKSYILFASLLLIETSTLFISASDSFLFIFFGFLVLFTGINLFIRNFSEKHNPKQTSFLSNYLTISSFALVLLFIGISAHALASSSLMLYVESISISLWEYIGEVFIILGSLIFIGGPPFHFIFFESEDSHYNSFAQIMLIVQKGLMLAFLTKYSLSISSTSLSSVLVWIFTVLGIIYILWGALACLTIKRLQKLIHYISILFTGVILLIISDLFSNALTDDLINQTLSTAFYGILIFMIGLSFSIASISAISKGFKTDDIQTLREIGRNSISQFIIVTVNILVLFIAPSSVLIISNKLIFPDFFTIRMYITAITLLLAMMFSLFYLIRLVKHTFFIPLKRRFEYDSPESAVFLASLISFVLIIILIVIMKQFLVFCSHFGINIT